MAKARNRAENQAWIELLHRVIAKTKRLHRAWPKIFDQHVGCLNESLQGFQGLRVLEVQRQAALATIDAHEVGALAVDKRRPVATRIVPGLRALDLHHIRPHVTQHHGAIGAGQDSRHI